LTVPEKVAKLVALAPAAEKAKAARPKAVRNIFCFEVMAILCSK
jgi:hypothetical protein